MNNSIWQVLLRRFVTSLIILFLLFSSIFFIIRLAPGNPLYKFISPKMSSQTIELVKEKYSIDEGIFYEYVSFVKNMFTGNLGFSYSFKQPVTEVILDYFLFTFIFTSLSFGSQFLLGCGLAIIVFNFLKNKIGKILSKLILALYSIPAFVLSIFLVLLLSVYFPIFPSSGVTSFDHDSYTLIGKLFDYLNHLFLPLLALTLYGLPVYYKYMYDNLRVNSQSDYKLQLLSMGVSETKILVQHIVPNSITPIITVGGIGFAQLLSGTLIIEVIFALPGLGKLAMNAVTARDYPLIIGCVILTSTLMILIIMLTDFIKAFLDRRNFEAQVI